MAFNPHPEQHEYYSSQYPQYPQEQIQFPQHSTMPQVPLYNAPSFLQDSAPQFPQHNVPQFPQPNVTHYEHHALPQQYPGSASQYPLQDSSWHPPQNGLNQFVKLSFSNRTVANTSITLNGTPQYNISTVDMTGAVTSIRDARTRMLTSTINRRTLHPDSVTFAQRYDGKVLRVKEWLVKSIEGTKWSIQAGLTTLTFLWDISNRLLVYQDSNREPVAWFDPATPAEPFSFHIKNGMENIWDLAVTAVVYIVHKRLLTDKFFAVNDASGSHQAQWAMFQQMAN
jgi:hypothetical protein